MRQHHITDETNKKGIYKLSLRKNIIRNAPIQSGIKHLRTSCAHNDVLEATLGMGTETRYLIGLGAKL